MIQKLPETLHEHREILYLLFRHIGLLGRTFLGRAELVHELDRFTDTAEGAPLRGTDMHDVIRRTQEAVVTDPYLHLAIRERVARWRYVQIHTQEMHLRETTVSEYLQAKERTVNDGRDRYVVEVDLSPFERDFPKLDVPDEIGCGVEYLNRHLSGRLAGAGKEAGDRLFEFLRVHQVHGRPLMLNGLVRDGADLRRSLAEALALLQDGEPSEGWERDLRRLGFEVGWGRTRERVVETMRLLSEILETPRPEQLADFLARVPMVFSIAVVSPHGYFGQANVLGKPDTGGQVVYILDQVRALERAMRASIREQGLDVEPNIVVLTRLIPEAGDTTCAQRLEPILGTRNARILRIPFRDRDGEVLSHWLPRFEVWPYLERYAVEAERELIAELGGRPDIVIGNYSDGNLVASILAHRLGVTQCNIAHALEKPKYRDSDLNWRSLDDTYHFSCQFTADLIAMNTADFIITSTYQEIAGTERAVGQYESYQSFTLPRLYRVVAGVDCFDPKFNIVSPGADPEVFFPYTEQLRRPEELTREIRAMAHGDIDMPSRGRWADPEKPILFAVSRLDRIKNMSGLLEWYAGRRRLQELANLLLVGGHLDPDASTDDDERAQIDRIHELISEHGLESRVRWLEMQTDKNTVGALYRYVADMRGVFVQPALFEAFGLTVVEAMSSGLPVFVTRYGGPQEIVTHGESGFHLDPLDPPEAVETMASFLERCREEPDAWRQVSEAAMRRVAERYTWSRYAGELLRLARIYGFWRHITSLERSETRRYLEMFYGLMYRPLAARVSGSETGAAPSRT
ncbi:MAG TPA: sucrose synthase [Longimicrobiales bacterium]|nr:sucrose synthase [Longimicrobiales bacterium]